MTAPTVILYHDAPQIGPHWDWLLGDPRDPAAARLATLRLQSRPVFGDREVIRACMLEPHRRHYLTYEGEVPGGRGTVRRVWSGRVRRLEVGTEHLAASIASTDGVWAVDARPRDDALGEYPWVVHLERADT